MSDYKLVPVEPTVKELYREFSQWCSEKRSMDFDCRLHNHGGRIEDGGYISHEKTRHAFAAYRAGRKMAMRAAAAPAAQGEPVAYVVFADNGNIRIWSEDPIQAETMRLKYGGSQVLPLYTAPQPAEHQPELAAPAVQGDVPEETINAVISLVKDAASTRLNSELNSCLSKIRELLYTAPQPAECTLNPDREQITEVEAPSNSLPSWSECNLRVGNSEWLKDNDIEADHDSLTANPLHEFIYEYDDSDAYKSAWFLHRLEKLIDFIRSEQQPDVAQLVEALERCVTSMIDSGYRADSVVIRAARYALAAHRKQGGES